MRVFGADVRSLAALRIALATLVLADLASRANDLTAHYTDRDVLPRSVLIDQLLAPWTLSLNVISGQLFVQAALFLVAAASAVSMLVGHRTRLMTAIVWGLLVSIQWHNPLVLNLGDVLLRRRLRSRRCAPDAVPTWLRLPALAVCCGGTLRPFRASARRSGWRMLWRSYFLRAIPTRGSPMPFLYLSRYLGREWNSRHDGDEQLEKLQVIYMLEPTLPARRVAGPFRRTMWSHNCVGAEQPGADVTAIP